MKTMGGSKVPKILAPFLLVATLWLAACRVEGQDLNDPFGQDDKAVTIPVNEVKVETNDDSDPHIADPDTQNNTFSALIKHGQEAAQNKYPFILSLQRESYSVDSRYHSCAGVLLDQRTFMTAAHCVYWAVQYNTVDKFWAFLGSVKLSSASGILRKIQHVYIHPKYTGYNYGYPHDIAVLVFDKEVTYSSSIQPAPLTPKGKRTFSSYLCDVAGWGYNEDFEYPDELMYVQQYWLYNYECKLLHKPYSYIHIKYRQLCTYRHKHTACYGDSGGPVICDGEVAGLISSTVSCSGCFGVMNTRVSGYRKWIAKMQQKANDDYFS